MNVVYLFCGSDAVRIPFFGYNPPDFFRLFINNGGFWDKQNNQFIFKKDFNFELLRKNINLPIVQFFYESSDKYRIFNFFLDPVNNKTDSVNSSLRVCAPVREMIQADQAFVFPAKQSLPEKLSEHWLKKLDEELRSRKYSRSTYKAYIYYNRLICSTLQKTAEEIRPDDVTGFIALMEKDKNYTASAMNLALSAIKFFFRYVLKKDDINDHHRPHQDGRLPMILSKEEIAKVLGMEKNPKHRLLLMLVYSSGLRVSEVVALKREHIDLSRKVIYVKLGKGRKDRSTLLSEKAAQFIEEYCNFFEINKWLFPGQRASHHLTIRSAQHIFDKAVQNAGIVKKITIHGLRHTFATHLLESGTDIRYIQALLGHANLRTTERYTHVARRNVLNIKSPLDSI